MPWMPGVIRKEITRHRTLIRIHRGLVQHVAVSNAASLFGFFNQSGNPTSHWYVRFDGDIEQYVDTRFRAPCQLEGNDDLLSIETWGGVGEDLNRPWNDAMKNSLAEIWAWASETHDFPLQLMPNSKSTSEGIGWHRQGVDPYRVDGGEKWSNAYGKVCPGPGKIGQMPEILIIAKSIGNPDTGGGSTPGSGGSTSGEELDMSVADDILTAVKGFRTEEAGRYQRSERIHQATMAALTAQNQLMMAQFTAIGNALVAIRNNEALDEAEDDRQAAAVQAAVDEVKKTTDALGVEVRALREIAPKA